MKVSRGALVALVTTMFAAACGGGGGSPPLPHAGGDSHGVKLPTAHAVKRIFYGRDYLKLHPEIKFGPNVRAAGGSNLVYGGGPIEKVMKVYLIFWGFSSAGDTKADPDGMATQLTNFTKSIGGSSWVNIDVQYYSNSSGNVTNPPNAFGGSWYDPSSVPSTYADSDVQTEAQKGASHFGYDADANYVVVTPHNTTISGFGPGGQFCAYHSSANGSGGSVAYTILPYQPDAGRNCGQGSVTSPGTLDGVTIVGGHEMLEAQTDPDASTGWLDSNGQENADKCAWTNLQNTAFANGSRFPTQPIWSNADSGCVQSYGGGPSPSPNPTSTPNPTPSPGPTSTPRPSPTPSPGPTASPNPTPSPFPTWAPWPTPFPTPTPPPWWCAYVPC
ncbi:MAG: hypothetical protein M3Y21_00465 [Candidatus Eremiobacteraeota bacterium]|nr:hypothetical protein [Candidatus Eremiobacteraeota bacterium]